MSPPLEEVERRLPTLALIDDGELRHAVAQISADAPEYFWHVAASSSEYHHPTCRGHRGLWLHTLMLSTVIERIVPSLVKQTDVAFDEDDADLAHAAAILHDQRKNGPAEASHRSSTQDHDLAMARVVRAAPVEYEPRARLDRIADAIEAHMGPWYEGPEPSDPLGHLVHTADLIASTGTIQPGVFGPLPSEFAAHDNIHVIVRGP